MTATVPGRPCLRYHGGKFRLAPWVVRHLPPHRVYVEPFAGAASVLMRKQRSYAEILNDLSGDVVNLFRVLRDPCRALELEVALLLTPFSREEFFAAYELTEEPVECARRLIVRSFMGHGTASSNPLHKTGFRNDSTRSHTTPARDWANFPHYLPGMTKRLQGVCIEHRPALDIIREFDRPETLFYADPPYVFGTRKSTGHGQGYEHEMTDGDHRELAELLRSVSGMVVLSGYRSDLYSELFEGWPSVERAVFADAQAARTEVLWFNAAAGSRLQSCLDFDGPEGKSI